VDLYRSLHAIAKLLLSEDDDDRTPELLLRRVLEAVEGERGFIVVREEGSYEQRFAVRFDRAALSDEERRFSRSLVRQAIETRQLVHLSNAADDPRAALVKSIGDAGRIAVLVAPLVSGGEVYGVVYVERDAPFAGPDDAALRFLAELAEIAGLFLRRAIERETLRRRSRTLEGDLFARHDFQGIVTRDPKMLALLKTVAQVADTDATVLIRGETGAGKELVARALHVNSPRRHKPCVTLHTTALPGAILESELFGHKKGAFTGADRDRAGRIATADGGTLFLDEVAEITPEVQAKLLRFLQFGEIQRVGSDRTEKVNVRVIAATHEDIPALVEAGRFRRDLYYRLNLIELLLPPLRERAGDVPLLVDHFLRQYWRLAGETPRWTPRAERALRAYAYPGNVRELAHAVERACILTNGPELDADLLPPAMAPATADPAPAPCFEALTGKELGAAREAAVAEVERAFLAALLERHQGNISQAARESGLHRTYLQKLLARHREEKGPAREMPDDDRERPR
jgi:Nif-specific regulatory protein/two-component system response regulator HydG